MQNHQSNDSEILANIIRTRRSVFPATYNDKPISTEVINEILASANYAPTHKLTQPWRFVVIPKEKLDHFAEVLSGTFKDMTPPEKFSEKKYLDIANKARRAGTIIAICMQTHPEQLPEWEEIASTACAVQNMWLTCTALGLGSYWSSPGMIRNLGDYLGLEEGQKCIGLFYMGYSDVVLPPSPRTDISEKVKWL